MNIKWCEHAKLNQKYSFVQHESGLKIYICPMEGFSSTMAMFGTKYGSIDTKFKLASDTDFTTVPEGIAHFLEHKLFESEDGDAFSKYAKTGAYANAFTSFDRTVYLFSCSDNFTDSFDILLNFVQSPYFTAATVQKEQGIIAQEINMYQDSAQWKVLFNLLRACYHTHPVRIDIAGTVESISEITDQLLYKCYGTFYNLSNMYICVAGNIDAEKTLAQIEATLKPNENKLAIERGTFDEPLEVKTEYVEQQLVVSQPLFTIGYKEACSLPEKTLKEKIEAEVILEILAGDSSKLYKELFDEGLINNSFGSEYFSGYGYALAIFEGESNNPKLVREKINTAIANLRKNGISQASFLRAVKRLYGRSTMRYNSVDNVAHSLVECAMSNSELFDDYSIYSKLTLNDLEMRFKNILLPEYSAQSVIIGEEK